MIWIAVAFVAGLLVAVLLSRALTGLWLWSPVLRGAAYQAFIATLNAVPEAT